mmetsp:Transcript_30231/g.34453  ORF Transcript_30231/g.34453 Transcript_30231/m.34453 type:complete len:106 (+) Transcript_30231:199-516(+)
MKTYLALLVAVSFGSIDSFVPSPSASVPSTTLIASTNRLFEEESDLSRRSFVTNIALAAPILTSQVAFAVDTPKGKKGAKPTSVKSTKGAKGAAAPTAAASSKKR